MKDDDSDINGYLTDTLSDYSSSKKVKKNILY